MFDPPASSPRARPWRGHPKLPQTSPLGVIEFDEHTAVASSSGKAMVKVNTETAVLKVSSPNITDESSTTGQAGAKDPSGILPVKAEADHVNDSTRPDDFVENVNAVDNVTNDKSVGDDDVVDADDLAPEPSSLPDASDIPQEEPKPADAEMDDSALISEQEAAEVNVNDKDKVELPSSSLAPDIKALQEESNVLLPEPELEDQQKVSLHRSMPNLRGRSQSNSPPSTPTGIHSRHRLVKSCSPSTRRRFVCRLPPLDETTGNLSFNKEDDERNTGYMSDGGSIKSGTAKRSMRGKSNRLNQVQELQEKATELAQTGQEEEAQKLYQEAIQIAGSEIARINFKIRKMQSQHEVTKQSILNRLSEDLHKVGIVVGKLRTKMAILYERSGAYDRAIACCREAMEIYKHQPLMEASKPDEKAEELLELTKLMVERLEVAHKALASRGKWLTQIENLRREIAHSTQVSEKHQLYARIEKLANKWKKLEIEVLGDSHPQVAETLQLLSTIALEQNKQDRAIELLQRAIKITRGTLGAKHPRTGQYYLRLARIFLSQGIESLALECFHEGTDILQHAPKFNRVLGSTFNDVGVLYMRRQEYDLAVASLKEALNKYGKALEEPKQRDPSAPKDCGLSIDSLQVHRNLGDCYMRQGEFDKAVAFFTKVLSLQRRARKVNNMVKDLKLGIFGVEKILISLIDDESIADSLMRLGRASAAGEHHVDALAHFKEALRILNELSLEDELNFDEKDEKSRNIRTEQITNTLYCIGEESCALGLYSEAFHVYGESMRLRGSYDLPGKEKTTVVHRTLCLIGMGDVYLKKKEYAEAHKHFTETLRYCKAKGVPEDHSLMGLILNRLDNTQTKMSAEFGKRTEEARTWESQADELIKTDKKYEEALATLVRAMDLRRTNLAQLRATTEDMSEEVRSIATLLRKFGSVYARDGDEENADRAYSDASRLFKKSGAFDHIFI